MREQTAGIAYKMREMITQLAEAYQYAMDADCDVWDFAIELPNLLACGLTRSDLRWLAIKGYVEHAWEVTEPRDARRRFRQERNLLFTERTCFVLTPAGAEFSGAASSEAPAPALHASASPDVVPAPRRRASRVGSRLPHPSGKRPRRQVVPIAGPQSGVDSGGVSGRRMAFLDRGSVAAQRRAMPQAPVERHHQVPEPEPREPSHRFSRRRQGGGRRLGVDSRRRTRPFRQRTVTGYTARG